MRAGQPRTRQVYDEKTWTGHEVVLDCYADVFAYGILLLPKDLKPGERRPVVVCQHGLEGTPRDTIDVEMARSFLALVERHHTESKLAQATAELEELDRTAAEKLRMADHGWKIGLTLFSFLASIAALYTSPPLKL